MIEDVIAKFKEITNLEKSLLNQIDNVKQNGISDALQIVQNASNQMTEHEKILEIEKSIERIEIIKRVKSLYIAYQINSQYSFRTIQDLNREDITIIVTNSDLIDSLEKQHINFVKLVKKSEVINELNAANTIFISETIPKNLPEDLPGYISTLLDYEDADEVLNACASIIHGLHTELWSGSIDEK